MTRNWFKKLLAKQRDALVLSALKAWLEYGITLSVVTDHKPSQ